MKKLNLKKIKSESLSAQELDIIEKILNDSSSYYVPNSFELNTFTEDILQKIQIKLNLESSSIAFEQVQIIEYLSPLNFIGKIGGKKRFILILLKNGQKLHFKIQTLDSLQGKETRKISQFLQDAKATEIDKLIIESIRNLFSKEKNKFNIDEANQFIEISPKIEFQILQNRHEQEIILAGLEIEQIKSSDDDSPQDSPIYFIQTNERQIIIRQKNAEILAQSKSRSLKEKTETGRNRYIWNNYSFLPTKQNRNKLKTLSQLPDDKLQAIRYLIVQNRLKNNYSETIHRQLIQLSENPYDELMLELWQAKNDKGKDTSKIVDLIKIILKNETQRRYLIQWIEDWQLNTEEQFFIIQIFLEYVQELDSVEDLLLMHRKVRENFMAKQKDKYEQALFDLAFCRHLIWADELEEAKKLIKKRLKNLPDESLWDILPAEEDSVEQLSGQYLRINYLKLLKKVSIDEEKEEILYKLAILQPLNTQLIKENQNLSPKFKLVEEILKGKIEVKNTDYNKITKILDEKLSQRIEHPLSSENKLISKLQNWLAPAEQQDLKTIKQYAENLKPEKQPQISAIIENLRHFYQIENIESYISYGKKASEITVFDDKPPFLLIGRDLIDAESKRNLHNNEFAFVAAMELSSLYFDNSRLTSSDVWKGLTQKGFFIAETLLTIIPAAGAISSGLKNLQKMEKISQWATTIGNIGLWGQNGISVLKSIHPVLEKLGKRETNEVEILFSSRLVQINADRLGLLAADDIAAALNGILKTHENYEAINERITKNGLINFLNEKDSAGKLKQKDLALRIAALFSFYFSDEFDRLSEFIRQENEESPKIFYK